MHLVDVLIVGGGPSGLTLATWMALTGVRTLLIEKRISGTHIGRADGLESRTLEILDSFGIGQQIWSEANRTVEICLWDDSKDGILRRQKTSANTEPGHSRFQECTLSQGRVEEHLQKLIEMHKNVEVRRGTVPTSLEIDHALLDDPTAYPIRMRLGDAPVKSRSIHMPTTPEKNASCSECHCEEVAARYVVGCDGAHSWVRAQLGLRPEGNSLNEQWGALDIVPITNFPDIRKRNVVKTKFGNLMIIPRERRMVRVYVQVSPTTAAEYKDREDCELLIDAIRIIMRPYSFGYSRVEWSAVYNVGQWICPQYSHADRIFLTGDAVHAHSPKAGQGMNVSIQDAHNLGWKLASVVLGALPPRMLQTYGEERLMVARRLITFDKRICRCMCGVKPGTRPYGSFDNDHKSALKEENTSASGMAVTYAPNALISSTGPQGCLDRVGLALPCFSKPHLARNIKIGARMPSEIVVSQSDAQPWQVQGLLKSTGEWNLIVFGGDILQETQRKRIDALATALSSEVSYIRRLNERRHEGYIVGTIAIHLIHSASRLDVELFDLPEIFRPFNERHGVDYGRVYADEKSYHSGGGNAYSSYGIAPEGCMILLRPDQHISFIGDLEDVGSLSRFVASFTR
ncbi:phenol 2-monooxygenase [Aspergillus udagawae]|nr:phenol 2-monooxygenase [Aspergillus udagawae]